MVLIGQPQTSMEIWDSGTYAAKVVGVEEAQSSFPGNEGKPRLKWRILVRNEDGETSEVWYWTNATLSTHKLATLRPLVRALFPDENLDDPQYVFDTEDAVGKRCRVILGVDEERGRNRIDKVLATEGKRIANAPQKPAARQPRAAVDEVDESEGAPPF